MFSKTILSSVFKILNVAAHATVASASISVNYQPKLPKSLRK